MAAHPVLKIGEGTIEIPEDLRSNPLFQQGTELRVVPAGIDAVILQRAAPRAVRSEAWRRLRGSLKDLPVNLNDELERDRLAEIAIDEKVWRR